MTELVREHFDAIHETETRSDGKNFWVFSDMLTLKSSPPALTNDDMSKGHHINFFTFLRFFELLATFKTPTIIETGSSAHGTNSSHLFDKYVSKYDGTFYTVDIDHQTTQRIKRMLSKKSYAINGDSVAFIESLQDSSVDAAYLDSWDIDWIDYNASAHHGRREMEALLPKLKNESIIMIDDTPYAPENLPFRNSTYYYLKNMSTMPGKGMYAEDVLKKANISYEKILHMYAIIFLVKKD